MGSETDEDLRNGDTIDDSGDETEYESDVETTACIPALAENVIVDSSMVFEGSREDPNKLSFPYLTKYEYVCILSFRVAQLENGALPLVKEYIKKPSQSHCEAIFNAELKAKLIPFILKRIYPNGHVDYIKVRSLKTDHCVS